MQDVTRNKYESVEGQPPCAAGILEGRIDALKWSTSLPVKKRERKKEERYSNVSARWYSRMAFRNTHAMRSQLFSLGQWKNNLARQLTGITLKTSPNDLVGDGSACAPSGTEGTGSYASSGGCTAKARRRPSDRTSPRSQSG